MNAEGPFGAKEGTQPAAAQDRPEDTPGGRDSGAQTSEENSIQGRRRRRGHKVAVSQEEISAPASRLQEIPVRPKGGIKSGSSESDPWTVPQSVRDRFVQDGNRFYFPDGAAAFRDLGRKLTTGSENTEVVHSLIEIAQARGWSEIKVAGTERFRQEAWRQARLAGLAVRGYQPSDDEQARVVRTLVRGLGRSTRPEEDVAAEAPMPQAPPPPTASSDSISPARTAAFADRITGKLLRHGRAPYRHDSREDLSYFVRIQTREGQREIWGRGYRAGNPEVPDAAADRRRHCPSARGKGCGHGASPRSGGGWACDPTNRRGLPHALDD